MSGITEHFAWVDLGSNTNLISTIVLIADFRNTMGQASADANDPEQL